MKVAGKLLSSTSRLPSKTTGCGRTTDRSFSERRPPTGARLMGGEIAKSCFGMCRCLCESWEERKTRFNREKTSGKSRVEKLSEEVPFGRGFRKFVLPHVFPACHRKQAGEQDASGVKQRLGVKLRVTAGPQRVECLPGDSLGDRDPIPKHGLNLELENRQKIGSRGLKYHRRPYRAFLGEGSFGGKSLGSLLETGYPRGGMVQTFPVPIGLEPALGELKI